MTSRSLRRRSQRSTNIAVAVLGVLSLGVMVALGCQKESLASAESTPEPAPASNETAPTGAQQSKLSESSFDLELKPSGSYKAGQQGAVEILLVAKGPYKVNDKYPYKFKVTQTDGVKYASLVVKDNVELEQKRARMKVQFTPESVGTKKVAGQFAFSVCTDERCLIEKRDLTLDVAVN